MSMRQAMQGKCTGPTPQPFQPILNPDPPYGNSGQQSKELGVETLIYRLLNNLFTKTERIGHIDVWGEGRILDGSNCTGFQTSFNINLNQGITFPTYIYQGYAIPNLLPVCTYNDTFDAIPNDCVDIITTMGAPITPLTASEISRIIHPDGAVIIYGYTSGNGQYQNLSNALSKIGFLKRNNYTLDNIFTAITLQPITVFSAETDPDIIEHTEL